MTHEKTAGPKRHDPKGNEGVWDYKIRVLLFLIQ